MRIHAIFPAALALSLALPAAAAAQTPPATKDAGPPKPAPPPLLAKLPATLEEMLSAALRSSPEILQAEARLQQAHARLNQVRLKVTQGVATAFHELAKQRELAALREQQAESLRKKVQTGLAGQLELEQALSAHAEARAQVAQVEAQIRYLLGLGGTVPGRGGEGAPVETSRRPEMPEKMKELLDRKVTLNIREDSDDRQSFFSEVFKGQVVIPIVNEAKATMRDRPPIHLQLQDVPLRTALLAITDVWDFCFVFRDYGILITSREDAARYHAATIPPDLSPGR